MYDRDGCLIVEVIHAHGYLLGPEQNLVEFNGVCLQIVIECTKLSIF